MLENALLEMFEILCFLQDFVRNAEDSSFGQASQEVSS